GSGKGGRGREERVPGLRGRSQDGAWRVGEGPRRLGAASARAVHHGKVVPLLLVERAHRRGFHPRGAGRRRVLAPGLAAHGQGEGRRRAGGCAGAASMKRGFTLLEVMISLAILAIALVAISGLNGGAVAMHAYGRRATEATRPLRGQT